MRIDVGMSWENRNRTGFPRGLQRFQWVANLALKVSGPFELVSSVMAMISPWP